MVAFTSTQIHTHMQAHTHMCTHPQWIDFYKTNSKLEVLVFFPFCDSLLEQKCTHKILYAWSSISGNKLFACGVLLSLTKTPNAVMSCEIKIMNIKSQSMCLAHPHKCVADH